MHLPVSLYAYACVCMCAAHVCVCALCEDCVDLATLFACVCVRHIINDKQKHFDFRQSISSDEAYFALRLLCHTVLLIFVTEKKKTTKRKYFFIQS